jgi:hypothetical protein
MGAMTWTLGWFGAGRKDDATPAARALQDKSRFHHSPELIGALTADHGELLRQYGKLERMAVGGQLAGLPLALAAFKVRFDEHILNENLHCYCYLEQKLQNDRKGLRAMQEFRSDMNGIARCVVNFVKTWRVAGVRRANVEPFLADLREVGAMLVQRIEREERDLYPLYRP